MAISDVFFTTGAGVGLAAPQIPSAATGGNTAGGTYMAKLGDFMFALDTAAFEQLQRVTEYRWTLLNRIGREPGAQFLGRGEDSIELSGAIYPHFRGGLSQMGMLRQIADTGEPQDLVYAFESLGQYAGRWAIKSLKEGRTVFFTDGTPRKIDFTVSLVAYGEDADMGGMSPTLDSAGVTSAPAELTTAGFVDDMTATASTVASLPAVTPASAVADVANVARAVADVATNAARVAEIVKRGGRAIISGIVGPAVVSILPPEAIATASSVMQTAEQVMIARDAVVKTAAVLCGQPVPLRGMIDDYRGKVLEYQRNMRSASADAARIADGVAQISGGVDRIVAAATMRNVARSADAMDFAVTEAAAQAQALEDKINV